MADVSFPEVLAARIRHLRHMYGLTQSDLANGARMLGLSWGRSTVATIEQATKRLTAQEFLALPFVFDEAFRISSGGEVAFEVSLSELLSPPGARDRLLIAERLRLSRQDVIAWLGSSQPVIAPRRALPVVGEAEQKAARSLGGSADEVLSVAVRLWGRSLSSERDKRAGDESAQARGHLTRALIDQIREELSQ